MDDPIVAFTIEDLARLLGLKPRTIHFWKQTGLFEGPGAGPGARYDEEHLGTLFLIDKLRSGGTSLAEIKKEISRQSSADLRRLAEQAKAAPKPPPPTAKELIAGWLSKPSDQRESTVGADAAVVSASRHAAAGWTVAAVRTRQFVGRLGTGPPRGRRGASRPATVNICKQKAGARAHRLRTASQQGVAPPMSLSLNTDRLLVRAAGGSTRHLHVSFRAPSAPARADRRPLTVAFVLDRSGSMSGQKLALAKRAIDAALTMLRPEDRFSVVTYDDRIDVLVPAMPASAEGRETARQRLDAIGARGSTDLSTGWLSGCEQIADVASDATIARTLLLSDGLANRGITNHDELAARAADLRRAYIVTSTFGVGRDFDESLMAAMADAGGGNFYFIEQPEQIQDMLTSELGEALEVVARRVVIDLELPDGVEAELLHRFRSTQTGNRLRIELDDLVSDQQISLIVKLKFPQGEVGNALRLRARVSSEDESVEGTSEIVWTLCGPRRERQAVTQRQRGPAGRGH